MQIPHVFMLIIFMNSFHIVYQYAFCIAGANCFLARLVDKSCFPDSGGSVVLWGFLHSLHNQQGQCSTGLNSAMASDIIHKYTGDCS